MSIARPPDACPVRVPRPVNTQTENCGLQNKSTDIEFRGTLFYLGHTRFAPRTARTPKCRSGRAVACHVHPPLP
eukprot:3843155-Prymnesium_polylepis.1